MSSRTARLARKEQPAQAGLPAIAGVHFQSHTSPLPPVEVLASYRTELATFPEDLRSEWLTQAGHRRTMETRVVFSQTGLANAGLWMAFVVAMCTIGGTFALAWFKSAEAAAVMAVVPVTGIIAALTWRRKTAEPKPADSRP